MPDPDRKLCFSTVLLEEFTALHPELFEAAADPAVPVSDPAVVAQQILDQEVRDLTNATPDPATEAPLSPPEAKQATEEWIEAAKEAAMNRLIHRHSHAALCLSGGGIRSATFALGVLQGLARFGLLNKFHYLSTVSGGGYIGSWLTAWIARHEQGLEGVVAELASHQTAAAGTPERIQEPEPAPIHHLRDYSNYLSPKLGLLSADSWTLAATYIRNLILNWLVWIPMLAAIMMVPRVCVPVIQSSLGEKSSVILWLLFIAGAASTILATRYVGLHRPSLMDVKREIKEGQLGFLLGCLLPLVLSAILFTTYWALLRHQKAIEIAGTSAPTAFAALGTPAVSAGLRVAETDHAESVERQLGGYLGPVLGAGLVPFLLFGALLNLSGWFTYGFQRPKHGARVTRVRKRIPELIIMLLTGATGGLLAGLLVTSWFATPSLNPFLYVSFAAPFHLIIYLLSFTVFVGLSSSWTEDEDREWWARMGGWVLIACIVWAVGSAVVFFGPSLLAMVPQYITTVGGISGLITLVLGGGPGTDAKTREKGSESGLAKIAKNWLPRLAAPVFAVFVAIGISSLTSIVLLSLARRIDAVDLEHHIQGTDSFTRPQAIFHHLEVVTHSPVVLLLVILMVFLGFSCLMAQVINTNRFSLAAMYRARLIRAYLGASRERKERRPNPFTGFDPEDNHCMKHLWPNRGHRETVKRHRLLHVVNMALNLVGGEDLGWQERKAESFTATALHSGNRRLGYRRSEDYGGPSGISLGGAVTISGAAANPNMGYHSSPVVAFLLTLFNGRLGAWLGNPGDAGDNTYKSQYPKWPMRTMLEEAFGLTDDRGAFVNLSDGGHFDNLGLYEMVLRRCRFILVSDAGCDLKFNFEDLGNAVRKIRIDMSIPIEFNKPLRLYPRAEQQKGRYGALARIRYSEADGTDPAEDGWLLYIKPAIYGNEPRDVLQYAKLQPDFPHQTTADQFFSESQFESYRALGLFEVSQVLRDWTDGDFDELAPFVDSHYLV